MTKEEQLYNLLCNLTFHANQAVRAYQAEKQLDSDFKGMGVNILTESAGKYYGTMERNLPKALAEIDRFLEENPPPWINNEE